MPTPKSCRRPGRSPPSSRRRGARARRRCARPPARLQSTRPWSGRQRRRGTTSETSTTRRCVHAHVFFSSKPRPRPPVYLFLNSSNLSLRHRPHVYSVYTSTCTIEPIRHYMCACHARPDPGCRHLQTERISPSPCAQVSERERKETPPSTLETIFNLFVRRREGGQ